MAHHEIHFLQDMAAKELSWRQKQDDLVSLANQAERAKQDAAAGAKEQLEAVKQAYRVRGRVHFKSIIDVH